IISFPLFPPFPPLPLSTSPPLPLSPWNVLQNKPLVSRVVVLLVPGIDAHTFHSRPDLFPNLHRCFGSKSLPLKAVSPSATVSDTMKAMCARPVALKKSTSSSSAKSAAATSAHADSKAGVGVTNGVGCESKEGTSSGLQGGEEKQTSEKDKGDEHEDEEEKEEGEEEEEEGEVFDSESEGEGEEGRGEGEVGRDEGEEGRDKAEGGRKRKAEVLGDGGGEGEEEEGEGRHSKTMKTSSEGERVVFAAEGPSTHTPAPPLPSSPLLPSSPSSPTSSLPLKSKPPLPPEHYLLTWRQLKENNFPLPVVADNKGRDGQDGKEAARKAGGGISLADGSALPPPGQIATFPGFPGQISSTQGQLPLIPSQILLIPGHISQMPGQIV
ncbi:unnamed protein product, partial [Closterium sp. NIES-54]